MLLKDLEAQLRRVAQRIRATLPSTVGFTLVLFTYQPGWVTYMSSAQRDDMIRTLEELLERWKAERETGASPGTGASA